MNKYEFLNEIRARLAGLPEDDIRKTIDFYTEAVEDRVEDGLTEDEAVAQMGTPAEITEKILMETPLPTLIKAQPAKEPKRKIRAWEVILIILGSPIWLPLVLAFAIVILALVVTVIAILLSLVFAVIVSGIAGILGMFSAIVSIFMGSGLKGFIDFSAALVITGLAVLLFIPIKAGAIWFVELMGRCASGIKRKFIKRRKTDVPAQIGEAPEQVSEVTGQISES